MGREYKKRIKEQYGRDAVVGFETVQMGRLLAPASATDSVLSDPQSVPRHQVNRPAKLDSVQVNVDPWLVAGSGTVTVFARVNGLAQSSGTVSAGSQHVDFTMETEKGEEVLLNQDDILTLTANKGATPSGVNVSARACLRLYEV